MPCLPRRSFSYITLVVCLKHIYACGLHSTQLYLNTYSVDAQKAPQLLQTCCSFYAYLVNTASLSHDALLRMDGSGTITCCSVTTFALMCPVLATVTLCSHRYTHTHTGEQRKSVFLSLGRIDGSISTSISSNGSSHYTPTAPSSTYSNNVPPSHTLPSKVMCTEGGASMMIGDGEKLNRFGAEDLCLLHLSEQHEAQTLPELSPHLQCTLHLA